MLVPEIIPACDLYSSFAPEATYPNVVAVILCPHAQAATKTEHTMMSPLQEPQAYHCITDKALYTMSHLTRHELLVTCRDVGKIWGSSHIAKCVLGKLLVFV